MVFWLNFFSKKNIKTEEEPLVFNSEETLKIVNDIFNKVDNIIFKKANNSFETDSFTLSLDNFEKIKTNLNDNWIDINYSAWIYIVSKNISNTEKSVSHILKEFKYIELKD